ncbi:hypothetical protein [Halobacterium wangiae]|uniref:hypothetical protein n=1 Tax=Halobacterium wangiae TaxID=2902623 RepID=UPI001E59F370|nr:hypothetical protein [Halobacterium wangiae]
MSSAWGDRSGRSSLPSLAGEFERAAAEAEAEDNQRAADSLVVLAAVVRGEDVPRGPAARVLKRVREDAGER